MLVVVVVLLADDIGNSNSNNYNKYYYYMTLTIYGSIHSDGVGGVHYPSVATTTTQQSTVVRDFDASIRMSRSSMILLFTVNYALL